MTGIPRCENFEAFLNETKQGTGAARLDIDRVNWPAEFPDKPSVSVCAAHSGAEIFLKFLVDEQYTLGRTTENNGPVWTDSCVEFFVAFDETGYYNFEFNCIGTMLLGFRKEREKYVHAGEDIISGIGRIPSLGREPFEERPVGRQWSIAIRIPVASFFRHDIKELSGMRAKANFFKCGDALSRPHFLSWQPIQSPKPDFHLEKFFGDIIFGV